MDKRIWCLLFFAVIPACKAWHPLVHRREEREVRRPHYHTKRHMLPTDSEVKKRTTTQKPREMRKKPSGHLAPLDEDDIENDEFVSVAIGPPPVRPKTNKPHWKPSMRPGNTVVPNVTATNLVKDILSQLGRELLSHQVSEDFVFGQYVGNSMKNLTSDLRLKMQHEILDVIVKYQKINAGEVKQDDKISTNVGSKDKLKFLNETEENWPDFSNLAKLVG